MFLLAPTWSSLFLFSISANTLRISTNGQLGSRLDSLVDVQQQQLSSVVESWNLTESLPSNDNNFIFETVSSLLQHWPNTRYRNGHILVPATIPKGTLLYHGTYKPEPPTIPDWAATDPEHSYVFCGKNFVPPVKSRIETETGGCWHLTFVTNRPLKLLYFDGSSAAKIRGGSMDAQDLLTWGEIKEDQFFNERERINKLCDWGKKYELDGFVRMEMDFEVMVCDFTAGLDPVSFLNVSRSAVPDNDRDKPISRFPARIRVIEAGSWANRFPGEDRIKLEYSKLISFYDEKSFPTLHRARSGQERWDHRLEAISKEEVNGLLTRLDKVLLSQESGSEIDWQALFRVVKNRYADRLELLAYQLNASTTSAAVEVEDVLRKAHRYVSGMLTPYILSNATPAKNKLEGDNGHDWASPVFKYCATTHIHYLENSLSSGLATESEVLLFNALRVVSKEICRVIVGIWAEGEEIWGVGTGGVDEPHLSAQRPRDQVLANWKASVSNLMKWLDWSIWIRCRPECTYEEMCYLPTWPYFLHPPPNRTSSLQFNTHTTPDEEAWRRPQPRCIRRLEPFSL